MIHRLSQSLDRICKIAASGFLLVLLSVIVLQVVARYLFASPPAWTEEIARYAMIWAGLLGAAVAFRAGADPVVMRRPRSGWFRFAVIVPVLVFPGTNLIWSPGFILRAADKSADVTGLPMLLFYGAVPVAAAITLIHALAMMFDQENP